ncbi:uncharacterized protein LOC131671721 [Phymastichus coffea]|uniref:uncharacterized protein LOC131671721 n=1 Tax=Phymastichus coffea TaxID=108790 RepID=UPI00273B952D|nr:uncharacterized protein LOC131671721 [Phymastichus coffea]
MRTRVLQFLLIISLVARLIKGRPHVNEQPLKFNLDTDKEVEGYADNTEKPAMKVTAISRLQDGMEWLDRMSDALRFARGRLVNSVAIAQNVLAERLEEFMSEARNNVAGAIGAANDIYAKSRSTLQSYENGPLGQLFPSKTRETVRLENEKDQAILENKKLNPISSLLENVFKPQPIVDKITEEEKYGNNGDKFIGLGRALVNGFEGLSNFINGIVDFPVKAAKNTSRSITEALNQIGSKLVGLQ